MIGMSAEVEIKMDNLDQVAMLLLSMGEDGAAKVLSHLDRHDVEILSHRMANLEPTTQSEASAVLSRFFHDYEEQAGIARASRSYLQRTLDLALGDSLSKGLLDSIYGDEVKLLMNRLEWVDSSTLARELQHEHVQLQAVLLALLDAEMAAQILELLPPQNHDEVLIRIAQLGDLDRDVLTELRELVERCMRMAMERSFTSVSGIPQVANIINRIQGDREGLMKSLYSYDRALGDEITDNMFDFLILPRQKADVLNEIIGEIDGETLALSLKGLDITTREVMLGALPKRMASTIEMQVDALGGVPLSQVMTARKQVMSIAKDMHNSGRIELQLFEEKVVE